MNQIQKQPNQPHSLSITLIPRCIDTQINEPFWERALASIQYYTGFNDQICLSSKTLTGRLIQSPTGITLPMLEEHCNGSNTHSNKISTFIQKLAGTQNLNVPEIRSLCQLLLRTYSIKLMQFIGATKDLSTRSQYLQALRYIASHADAFRCFQYILSETEDRNKIAANLIQTQLAIPHENAYYITRALCDSLKRTIIPLPIFKAILKNKHPHKLITLLTGLKCFNLMKQVCESSDVEDATKKKLFDFLSSTSIDTSDLPISLTIQLMEIRYKTLIKTQGDQGELLTLCEKLATFYNEILIDYIQACFYAKMAKKLESNSGEIYMYLSFYYDDIDQEYNVVKLNKKKAFEYAKIAFSKDFSLSKVALSLGRFYENGVVVQKDMVLASIYKNYGKMLHEQGTDNKDTLYPQFKKAYDAHHLNIETATHQQLTSATEAYQQAYMGLNPKDEKHQAILAKIALNK